VVKSKNRLSLDVADDEEEGDEDEEEVFGLGADDDEARRPSAVRG